MSQRNFKEELDRVTAEFERESAMLEQVWEALGQRGADIIDVDPRDLAAIEDACSWNPGCNAPSSSIRHFVRC